MLTEERGDAKLHRLSPQLHRPPLLPCARAAAAPMRVRRRRFASPPLRLAGDALAGEDGEKGAKEEREARCCRCSAAHVDLRARAELSRHPAARAGLRLHRSAPQRAGRPCSGTGREERSPGPLAAAAR